MRACTSLGLRLVRDLSERQLMGAIHLAPGPGTRFELSFPPARTTRSPA